METRRSSAFIHPKWLSSKEMARGNGCRTAAIRGPGGQARGANPALVSGLSGNTSPWSRPPAAGQMQKLHETWFPTQVRDLPYEEE
jgi:hypothetical protein